MPLNTSIIKEIIILIMGPVFQVLAYFILLKIMPDQIESIKLYHYSILIFNLLPVYPLDGGKLVNLFFSLKFSFKNSFYLEIFISYLMVFLLIIVNMLHKLFLWFYCNQIIISFNFFLFSFVIILCICKINIVIFILKIISANS